MELPEKEAFGEIIPGIGKATMTNETIEICILCGMTDAFSPGEIKHDRKIHDQEREERQRKEKARLQVKDNSKKTRGQAKKDLDILKALGAKPREKF